MEHDIEITIQNWLKLVGQDAELTRIPLSRNERMGHLPKFFRDLVLRLRLDTGLASPISMAARDHGEVRRRQGYTASMVVDESRLLEVSIYSTLQRNLRSVDFSRVLLDVVTIADEVDSQLEQAMHSYVIPTVISKSRMEQLAGSGRVKDKETWRAAMSTRGFACDLYYTWDEAREAAQRQKIMRPHSPYVRTKQLSRGRDEIHVWVSQIGG